MKTKKEHKRSRSRSATRAPIEIEPRSHRGRVDYDRNYDRDYDRDRGRNYDCNSSREYQRNYTYDSQGRHLPDWAVIGPQPSVRLWWGILDWWKVDIVAREHLFNLSQYSQRGYDESNNIVAQLLKKKATCM